MINFTLRLPTDLHDRLTAKAATDRKSPQLRAAAPS
ncbi:toxin-antitoxin system HicB family antitoxin [Kitasatospora sp. NPDC058190]